MGQAAKRRYRPWLDHRYRPDRVGLAVCATGVLLSALLLTAPGRSPAGPLTESGVPAAAPRFAPPGAALDAAGRDAVRRGERAEVATTTVRTDPLFSPVAEPAPGAVTPRVARLVLGSFERPAPGVQSRAGLPRGLPVHEDAGTLRGARTTGTLAVRRTGTAEFGAVGVTWTGGAGAPLSVAVRSHVPGQGWSPWRTASPAAADRDVDVPTRPSVGPPPRRDATRDPAAADRRQPTPTWRNGTDLIWLGTADGIEIQVSGARGRGVADLAVDLIDPLRAPADGATLPAEPGSTAAPGTDRVAMPPIVRRAGWGADERLMTWAPVQAGPVRAVAFHHTATGNGYQPADVPRLLRAVYYHQAVARGWGDIGYHVIVDRFGGLWEGRSGGLSRPVVGAHTGGFNRHTAGLAALGDHRSTPVPAAAVQAGSRYVAWKLSLGPAADPRGTVRLTGGGSTSRHPAGSTVTVPRIFPHRFTNHTEGPGDRGVDALGPLRDAAHQHLGAWADPATLRVRLATWRASDARWRILGGADPALAGVAGDLPAAADYDGDGGTDPAVWTPGTGTWRIANSGGGSAEHRSLGQPGDRPVPGDYDGDGRAEPAVWRSADGTWLFAGGPPVQWGSPGDVPVPADYDGDGRTDLGVWRPSTGTWYVLGVGAYRLGESYHVPVPGDYDGDGDAEPASWSPLTHRWFVWGQQPTEFGQAGDVPVPGQYDGDGRVDLAVWRPPAGTGTEGLWLIDRRGSFAFGRPGDVPAALP